MIMLGFITDDLQTNDSTELRAIADTWFVDCAKHNDLHKILQVGVKHVGRYTVLVLDALPHAINPSECKSFNPACSNRKSNNSKWRA